MASGKVKWWDNKKGFGFIAQESGQDVFVHHTAILGGGFKTLNEGEEVTFDVVASEKGPKATNVHRPWAHNLAPLPNPDYPRWQRLADFVLSPEGCF
jgi:CspA family cold shock protein